MHARQSTPSIAPVEQVTPAPQTGLDEGARAERNVAGVPTNDVWDHARLKQQLENDPAGYNGEQYAAIVARLVRRSPAEGNALLGDAATMTRLCAVVSPEQATMILLYLRPSLPDAVRWQCAAGGINLAAWSRLVSGRTADECLAAVTHTPTYVILRNVSGATALEMFPTLTLDPVKFQEALKAQESFLGWIVKTDGLARAAEVLNRLAEFQVDQNMREGLQSLGLYDSIVSLMPSPCTDERLARRLYNWLLCATDADEGALLFETRYGVKLTTDNGAQWDLPSIIRVWQVCGRVPLEHVTTAVRIIREGDTGEASGWANARGDIGMEWGTDVIGANEVGAYTEDYDPMRGLNIFDAALRHEIGHTVGFSYKFDQPGGFVFTDFDWQEHKDWGSLVDTFVAAHPLTNVTPLQASRILGAIKQVNTWSKDAVDERLQTWANHYGDPEIKTKGQAQPLYAFIVDRMRGSPWNRMVDVGGRSYHVDYAPDGTWVSCPVGLYAKKVSTYAMRSPAEWFAEAYATFYADADTPNQRVGTLLKSHDAKLYEKMYRKVHLTKWGNLFSRTGQDLGHDTMGV